MTKAEWGVPLWAILHKIAAKLPDTFPRVDIIQIQQFFLQVSDYIPCAKCRGHYSEYCTANSPSKILSRNDAVLWVWNLHNLVNTRNSKPIVPLEETDRYITEPVKPDIAIFDAVLNRRVIDRRMEPKSLAIFRKWMTYMESIHRIS